MPDGSSQRLDGGFVGVEGGPPAAFVGDLRSIREQDTRGPVGLRGPIERLGECDGARRRHHEGLDVDASAGMGATTEDLDLEPGTVTGPPASWAHRGMPATAAAAWTHAIDVATSELAPIVEKSPGGIERTDGDADRPLVGDVRTDVTR